MNNERKRKSISLIYYITCGYFSYNNSQIFAKIK